MRAKVMAKPLLVSPVRRMRAEKVFFAIFSKVEASRCWWREYLANSWRNVDVGTKRRHPQDTGNHRPFHGGTGLPGWGKTHSSGGDVSREHVAGERASLCVGLGPTHRAVGGDAAAPAWMHRHWRPFCMTRSAAAAAGETPDFSNTLFLLDESSPVGNTDMARAYALIGPVAVAVASGDTDQLQAIAPGQPSVPADAQRCRCGPSWRRLRVDAGTGGRVYSPINRDGKGKLSGLWESETVPRCHVWSGRMGTGALRDGVQSQPWSETGRSAAEGDAERRGGFFRMSGLTLHEAIVRDYTGRTPEAIGSRRWIVTHLNEDWRVPNSMIHDAREKAGELGKRAGHGACPGTQRIYVTGSCVVFSTGRITRMPLPRWIVYHRIAGISKDDGW